MENLTERELIYDWNLHGDGHPRRDKPIEFDDETLRDGLQSPSVTDPPIETKIRMLHYMEALGIHGANLGLPAAGPRAREDVYRLAKEIADAGLQIFPNCAARTVEADIIPIIEISQKTGMAIEAATFIGSSPIRQYAEEWDIDWLLRTTEAAVDFAVKHALPVMFVTEDTSRAHPEDLRRLYTTAINFGAKRICLCDTVGHAVPRGVTHLVNFAKAMVAATGEDVKIDWHGHRDRGLDVANSLAAIEAGIDRVHGTALGIGERVGNASIDLILVNCRLMGLIDNDLTRLREYCQLVSQAYGVPIPRNYPVIGEDAFRTATGVHAAAIIKAEKKGDRWLADRVYSGVPAEKFGCEQKIEIGFMSGESNVIYWLRAHGIEPERALVGAIFRAAKESNRLLTDAEVMTIVARHRDTASQGAPVSTTSN